MPNLIPAVEPLSRRVSLDWQFIFKKNADFRKKVTDLDLSEKGWQTGLPR